jgi:hypothetical protein
MEMVLCSNAGPGSHEGAYTMKRLIDVNYRLDAIDCAASKLFRWTPRVIGVSGAFALLRWSIATIALTIWISCGLAAAQSPAAQDVPSGTIKLSGGSLAAGVGYTWGSGTLTYQGKDYPLTVNGISLLHAGASSYDASGAVFHLTKLSDFNGVYTAVSPRSSLLESGNTIAMKNPNGVVIQMKATQTGFAFSLGPNGMTISLQQ